MPFAADSFDIVLLRHVLEHVRDYRPVLEEAVRVTRSLVVVDFFHALTCLPFNLNLFDPRGFWNNWYSRSQFDAFVRTLPVEAHDCVFTVGDVGQRAEVHVLQKM